MMLHAVLSLLLIGMIAASDVCKGFIYGNTTEPVPFDVTNEPCFVFPEPINTTKIEVEGSDAFIYAFEKDDCADVLLRRSLNPLQFDPAKVVRSVIIRCDNKSEE